MTFGGVTTTLILSDAVTTPTPMAATTKPAAIMVAALVMAPTTTHEMSCTLEFDKGGQCSSSNCRKFQNHEQWLKWHCTLMGSAYEHKCEQVLDPTHVPNPNVPDEIAFCVSRLFQDVD